MRARAGATLIVVLMTVGIGWLARAPYQPPGAEDALLRLSWRLRAPAADVCRPRTQAELDALPAHMRTPEVCEKRSTVYRLVVQLDSLVADSTRVLQGGARADRPLFVLRERRVAPGRHRVRIDFAPENGDPSGLVRPLSLDTVLQMESGAVVLITLDTEASRFLVRRSVQP
jgi:hypothetical protein